MVASRTTAAAVLIRETVTSFLAGPSDVDRLVGTVMDDRFELLAFAAAGGMGRVYRARDRETGEICAVKLLPSDGDIARFAREAEVLAAIEHPGVVRYLTHGAAVTGDRYLAMEWLTGEDLSHKLEEGTLGVADTLALAGCVADSLAAAHRRGIVHRDLKPSNLFLVDGRLDAIKLLDFGVARAIESTELTATGAMVGTPAYMSPEQVRGGAVDARADVYGLGAVMFRCLSGHPPFRGAHPLAVFAKVVLEPAPRIGTIRSDVPAPLEALLARLLAKEPELRPAHGAALVDELRVLSDAPLSTRAVVRMPGAITAREQRIACVVLCARMADIDATRPEHGTGETDDAVLRAIEERGGILDALAKGAWVITIPSAASPAEQAVRAARCALALAALRPDAPIFVATGRVLVDGATRVGEVIDRAAEALVDAKTKGTGGVMLDVATAELLAGRMPITGDGEWRRLVDEEAAVVPARRFLGKPIPCVGRAPQLAVLTALLHAAREESRACAALVSAPPGLGKSHLAHELLRAAVIARGDVDVLFAACDPMRATSSFAALGQLLRHAAGMRDSDSPRLRAKKLEALVAGDVSPPDAPRMVEVLGEICGVYTSQGDASPALRAARADLSIMADAVREAWTDWIAARADRRTLLVLVEDLHWADAASVLLLEAALRANEDRSVFFLATARPGDATAAVDRLRGLGLVELALAPLSLRASERLVREALGGNADEATVKDLARRAGGHPFHLEELVRAVAAGHGADALPDSVLGMVQARFDHLGAVARRLLRAASVFGVTFSVGGVAALLGDDLMPHEVRAALAELVEGEMVTELRARPGPSGTEYRFHHALLRDGAYATLAEPDRVQAHRRAADWLEAHGESDPAVLAEHYDRGDAPDLARALFGRAAAQALHHHDFERAMAHAARARGLAPDAAGHAALSAIEAEVLYWRGDLVAAADRAGEAASGLTHGAREWFDAVSVAVGALGQLGRNEGVAAWLDDASRVTSSPENRGAHIVALCRGMTQLFWAHHGGDLALVRGCLDTLVDRADAIDAYTAGWVHRVHGESAWLHEHHIERCMTTLEASCESFDRARALRALCLTRINAASLAGWSGAWSHGLEQLAQSRAESERLGSGFLQRYSKIVEALLLAYAGEGTAESAMRTARLHVKGSPRLSFIGHVVVGWLALESGKVEDADTEAMAAASIHVAKELRPAALALAARVALARGHDEKAVRLALDAGSAESACSDLELTYGTAGFALAEAYAARDEGAARAALAPVVRRLASIASTIASPEQRARFWQRPLPNASVVRLAARLGVEIPEP
jgi:hypothetical protein